MTLPSTIPERDIVTPDRFVEMTCAYAKTVNATHALIANTWWNVYFPKSPAKLQSATHEYFKKYPIESYRDPEWVEAYAKWWHGQISPIIAQIEALLA